MAGPSVAGPSFPIPGHTPFRYLISVLTVHPKQTQILLDSLASSPRLPPRRPASLRWTSPPASASASPTPPPPPVPSPHQKKRGGMEVQRDHEPAGDPASMARPDQPFLWPSLSTSSAPDPPRPGSISTTTHRHLPPWQETTAPSTSPTLFLRCFRLTPLVVDLPRRGSGETLELVVMLSGTTGCSHEEKLLLQDAVLPSSNPLTCRHAPWTMMTTRASIATTTPCTWSNSATTSSTAYIGCSCLRH